MKKLSALIMASCLATISSSTGDWYTRWNGAGTTWYEKWKTILNRVDSLPLEERMALLGKGVILGKNAGTSGERLEIFTRAQAKLLSIPGHAKYYQDKIGSLRAEVLANAKLSDEEVMKMQQAGNQPIHSGDYDDFRDEAFRILSQLPSSETVAVLGHFLNDPEGRDHRNLLGHDIDGPDASPTPPNADAAAMAIRNLGIEHPPFKTPEGREREFLREGEVDAWKDWWNEVKDGKRTYRFIGSSIEYGPDGPATPEQIQRIGRDQKREAERASGIRRSSHPDPGATRGISDATKPSTITAIVAALGAVIAAIWYVLIRKSRRTG